MDLQKICTCAMSLISRNFSTMKENLLILGGIYGGLAVLFGAFGAHALKKILPESLQESFETGVRYQMYHAIILIVCAILFPFTTTSQLIMGWCFALGTFLFSFSIYGLVLSSVKGRKLKIMGPVTPLGGLLLLIAWALFTYNVMEYGVNLLQ